MRPVSDDLDPDAELVGRFRAGDRAAFDALATRHRDAVLRLVRRYVKRDADAADVAQKALLRAFEKIDGFRGEATFRTWLCRIAIHVALNHTRAERRFEDVELDDIASFTNALETGKLVAAELWQKVSARLADLPPKQRLVVELRLFHDLSFKEIADVAATTEESAKANYHHGVKRLRDVIGKG
jgi:RNA polymerase sigma-70 factor (ECF subfamily)